MRVVRLAVVSAVLSLPAAGGAQATSRQALGVREFRGERLPVAFGASLVAATEDGLVALIVDDRLLEGHGIGREPLSSREYFRPEDVLEWVSGINALAASLEKGAAGSVPSVTLGATGGVFIRVGGATGNNRGAVGLVINRCRVTQDETSVDARSLVLAGAAFRRAALQAQRLPQREPPDDTAWFGHAIACPAIADPGNRAPAWPDEVRELRPYQELLQFVVDVSGRVVPGSEQFLASSDARFAASIRRVLPTWRFTPARRMSRPARQLMHVAVGFTPPVAVGAERRSCDDGRALTRCDSLFTTVLGYDIASILPQGDGAIRIANGLESNGRYRIAERGHISATVPAATFRQFIDTVAMLLPTMDTSHTQPRSADWEYSPNAPMLGDPNGLGLNMWLSATGWIRAGYWCGPDGSGQARFMEVTPQDFPRFRRMALDAVEHVAEQTPWAPRSGQPFVEHELTCYPRRRGHQPIPGLQGRDVASIESMVRLIVDEEGSVEPSSIEIMPGPDSTVRDALAEALKRWTFYPAIASGQPVRALTHLNIIVRPVEADAVALSAFSRELTPGDTLRRTVFFKPEEAAPDPFPVRLTNPRLAMDILQPYVDRARASWQQARNQLVVGLPVASNLIVTTLVGDNLGNSSFVSIQVERVIDGMIHGRIRTDVGAVAGWTRGDQFSLREDELIDWAIVRANGTSEGNFLGPFFDSYRERRD